MYFFDTNTCIYALKGLYDLRTKILGFRPDEITIPSIVKAELLYGAKKSNHPKKATSSVSEFLFPFEVFDFNERTSVHYADIRSSLEKKGTPIGPNDLIIAAIVRAESGVLVTHNIQEFKRVRNLVIEDWVG